MNNPKFQIFNGSNHQFYFHLTAVNGEKILSGEGYTSKANCLNGIQSVRLNSQIDPKYRQHKSVNNQHYFVLLGGNGEIIGVSETYLRSQSLENGIAAVKRDAPLASIEDLTEQKAS
jgi:uncharacterized protein YegP (UPF0339 family)